MSRPVTFMGAFDISHVVASPTKRAVGSMNVFVHGIPVSRQFDVNTPHLMTPKGPTHVGFILTGSLTVFTNARGTGRSLDLLSATCTFVAQGSPTVFAGG